MVEYSIGKTMQNKILVLGGRELNKYRNLSESEKSEIFLEIYLRIIRNLLIENGKEKRLSWAVSDTVSKLKAYDMLAEYPFRFSIRGKNPADKAVGVIAINYAKMTSLELLDVKTQFQAKDVETANGYEESVRNEIIKVRKKLESNYMKVAFVKTFFEVLGERKICYVGSGDLMNMLRIVYNASKRFPLFATLPQGTKAKILQEAYSWAMRESAGKRDIYTFSMHTYIQFLKYGVADKVVMHIYATNSVHTLEKIGTSANGYRINKVYTIPAFVDYKYTAGKVEMRTSVLSSSLWELLTKTGD